ncbi:MAG: sensor histidine kinase [Sphingomonas sp.]|nr:sensor histidine kinase [Sphingomonas sp.]
MAGALRRRARSITVQFVFAAFLSQLLLTVGILLFVQHKTERALQSYQREWVEELSGDLIESYRRGGLSMLKESVDSRAAARRGNLAILLLIGPDGTRIAGNLDSWPLPLPAETPWRELTLRQADGRPEHIVARATLLPDGSRLMTGRIIETELDPGRIREAAFAAAVGLGALLGLIGALILGRILSARIGDIVETTVAIRRGALSSRIAVNGSGDAFDELGAAINAMLDQIERLMAELRLMTDGLAHDFRSPVTRLKSVIERAAAATDDERAGAALESAGREADTLLAMLSTALLISRTEAGMGREQFVDTDIAAMLHDLAEIYGPLAEEEGFVLAVDAPSGLKVALNPQLVGQAIGNLIENALHYAEGGTRIVLSAKANRDHVMLCIADNGPGIPADRREEALRRFGRLDPARTESGSGLGLSLVAAVATLHGGTIRLDDARPGLCVLMSLRR